MEIDCGRPDRGVAEQELNRVQIDSGLQKMGGEAVTKGVAACGLRNGRFALRTFERLANGVDGDMVFRAGVFREEPVLRPVLFPVLPQRFEGDLRQQGIAVFIPLALIHPQEHAGTVDVRDLEPCRLAYSESRRVGHHEYNFLLESDRRVEYFLYLALGQDSRNRLGRLGIGNPVHHPAFAEGGLIEKPERAVVDLKRRLGKLSHLDNREQK